MGRNVQPTIILCLALVWMSLVAVSAASSNTSCTVAVTQNMMIRLINTNQTDGDCAGTWNSVQTYLEQTTQNLTDCLQREVYSSVVATPTAACQSLFEQVEKQSEEVRQKINKAMQNKLLYEQIEIAKAKAEIVRLGKAVKSVQAEFKDFYQQLLLLYIDAGDTRRALRQYEQLVSLNETNLPQTVVKFVYITPKHENRRLENLLALVKQLPSAEEQMTLYKLIQPEIVNRNTQQSSFLAMVASQDMSKFVNEKEETEFKQLRDAMFQHVMKRWKQQILSGKYQDIVTFARKYPDNFDKIGARVARVYPQFWFKFSYSQFVTYPNLLPLPKQRLQAFRVILQQVKERNKTYFAYYLAKLAKQVDICEQYIRKQYGELEGKEELIKLKLQFSDFDKNNGYEYYLKNVDKLTKTKPPLPANPNRPKSRGGLNGRR